MCEVEVTDDKIQFKCNLDDYFKTEEELCKGKLQVAYNITPGYYHSVACGIILIIDNYVSTDDNLLMFVNMWLQDYSKTMHNNMRTPEWLEENANKLDFSKLDKCPLCKGTGRKVVLESLEPGPDYACKYSYCDCDFCEVFEYEKSKYNK